ncbi:tyrosinase family oxidase copper chaperone [Umezawaea beigongshangensis]|uniref:tyrosinase family oxidase copper chaperone n=1 Tax=Umezawaea beigongshangensis TaxID=2780383 RepID=UPI0018F17A53|nr:tyrosinase family oxidase copper chaperone [Umezawaea beigongshangensis]
MTDISRRDVFRHGAAAVLVTATAFGYVTSSSSVGRTGSRERSAAADPRDFEEVYKGKKIKGEHDRANGQHRVHINGRKLGVAQVQLPVSPTSTETFTAVISTVNHFEPVPLDETNNRDGLKKLAKIVVDQLGDQELTRDADHHHH